jgi:hypothetical protein
MALHDDCDDEILEIVQRELDGLVGTRSLNGLTQMDELRYAYLCKKERELLALRNGRLRVADGSGRRRHDNEMPSRLGVV